MTDIVIIKIVMTPDNRKTGHMFSPFVLLPRSCYFSVFRF